jgi:amidase
LDFAPFSDRLATLTPSRVAMLDRLVLRATIPELQVHLRTGRLSATELTTYYIFRIQQYDSNRLNSVAELNPAALEMAGQLDAERKSGKVRGPLHGTVALLIDVIGTGDAMHNTAGAMALVNARSDRDAYVVKKLREAGVVILGKTSLTEWTGFISTAQIQGYSTLGGQVTNPYNSAADPSGSSTGSAVAVAANLATFALSQETLAGATLPALANGVITLRPSFGLISRDRVIPNLPDHDTVAPVTRHVVDLALVTKAMAGQDENDPLTNQSDRVAAQISIRPNRQLNGKRVGLLPPQTAEDEQFHKRVLKALQLAGATVVQLPAQPSLFPDFFAELDPINAHGFRKGVEQYLRDTNAPLQTLQQIVAYNAADLQTRVKYGQDYLEMAATSTMNDAEYASKLKALNLRAEGQLSALLQGQKLNFIVGVQFAVPFSLLYDAAGCPAITLPVGYRTDNTPVGMMILGKRGADADVFAAGFALESRLNAWQPPNRGTPAN